MVCSPFPSIEDIERYPIAGYITCRSCRGFLKHGGGERCGKPSTVVYLEWVVQGEDAMITRGFCAECDPGVGTPLSIEEFEILLVMRL